MKLFYVITCDREMHRKWELANNNKTQIEIVENYGFQILINGWKFNKGSEWDGGTNYVGM